MIDPKNKTTRTAEGKKRRPYGRQRLALRRRSAAALLP